MGSVWSVWVAWPTPDRDWPATRHKESTSDSRVRPDSDVSHVRADSLRRSDGVCDHGTVADRTRQPPSRRVEAAIRERIAAGEWQPEERLPSVADFASQYGVSRSSVAAALKRIEADGLIEIVPQWGTFRV